MQGEALPLAPPVLDTSQFAGLPDAGTNIPMHGFPLVCENVPCFAALGHLAGHILRLQSHGRACGWTIKAKKKLVKCMVFSYIQHENYLTIYFYYIKIKVKNSLKQTL